MLGVWDPSVPWAHHMEGFDHGDLHFWVQLTSSSPCCGSCGERVAPYHFTSDPCHRSRGNALTGCRDSRWMNCLPSPIWWQPLEPLPSSESILFPWPPPCLGYQRPQRISWLRHLKSCQHQMLSFVIFFLYPGHTGL